MAHPLLNTDGRYVGIHSRSFRDDVQGDGQFGGGPLASSILRFIRAYHRHGAEIPYRYPKYFMKNCKLELNLPTLQNISGSIFTIRICSTRCTRSYILCVLGSELVESVQNSLRRGRFAS